MISTPALLKQVLSICLAFAALSGCAVANETTVNDGTEQLFPTKFGIVTRERSTGNIVLAGDLLLKTNARVNGYGSPLYFSTLDGFRGEMKGFEEVDRTAERVVVTQNGMQSRMRPVRREVFAEVATANCINQFVIVDFTMGKPYVSSFFGPNPEGKFCLEFTKAEWGKKESYIYLGEAKYVYYTGGRVIGPID